MSSESFPYAVREIENVFIPVPGGRLAARIWLPETADSAPVPAILEYIPYRKGDRMRERDEAIHRYFAGHGYAGVRVDVRGSGDSDGVLDDEYLPREIDDARHVIRWLAAQSWCTGAVGMMGKSWGGFIALQVAASGGIEPLRAVIAVCCSDDRYTDDAHFMGGSPLNENFFWGVVLTSLRIMPPDPANVGDRWRAMWLERLTAAVPLAEKWLRHQRRDSYWDQGSVSKDYEAVACPVFAVGGWADAYTNGVFRLLAKLEVPRRGLIGPWAHAYPQDGVPGPPIGFLQEALRFWGRWLAGRDAGVQDEPMLRAWMPESRRPAAARYESSGRWVAEPEWPPRDRRDRRIGLGPGALLDAGSEDAAMVLLSPLSTGSQAGSWCPFGAEGMPRDQAPDDDRSVCFDSPPLGERLEILGEPQLRLTLASDRPVATLVARLEDVFPDGVSSRVTYGILNLTHRSGHEHPRPLPVGRPVEVVLPLKHVAHAFLPGQRIRLALSTSYWPIVWPAPAEATLTLYTRDSSLTLPVRTPRPEDDALRPFEPPEGAPPSPTTEITAGRTTGRVHHDPVTGESVREFAADFDENGAPGLSRVEATGIAFGDALAARMSVRDGDPGSARVEARHHALFEREGFRVGTRVAARMTADETRFLLETEIEGFEGDERVFERRFRTEVPRDLA